MIFNAEQDLHTGEVASSILAAPTSFVGCINGLSVFGPCDTRRGATTDNENGRNPTVKIRGFRSLLFWLCWGVPVECIFHRVRYFRSTLQ
jgi:hypothetical protein